jgi:hypothetical protein
MARAPSSGRMASTSGPAVAGTLDGPEDSGPPWGWWGRDPVVVQRNTIARVPPAGPGDPDLRLVPLSPLRPLWRAVASRWHRAGAVRRQGVAIIFSVPMSNVGGTGRVRRSDRSGTQAGIEPAMAAGSRNSDRLCRSGTTSAHPCIIGCERHPRSSRDLIPRRRRSSPEGRRPLGCNCVDNSCRSGGADGSNAVSAVMVGQCPPGRRLVTGGRCTRPDQSVARSTRPRRRGLCGVRRATRQSRPEWTVRRERTGTGSASSVGSACEPATSGASSRLSVPSPGLGKGWGHHRGRPRGQSRL